MKHHTVTLTRGQLEAIGAGRLAPAPGVARLWQVEQHQLRTGHTVETREPDLNARITFLPVTDHRR